MKEERLTPFYQKSRIHSYVMPDFPAYNWMYKSAELNEYRFLVK